MLSPADQARIASYVDGVMAESERTAFERDAAANPELQAEVQAHRALEGSLQRLFEHDHGAAAAPLALPFTRARRFKPMRLAAAALLAIGTVAAFMVLLPDPLLIAPEVVWNNVEKAHFQPSWKCVDDAEFRAYLISRMGEAFTVEQSPSLQVVGWAYGRDYAQYPLSKDTLILINKVGDDHSIVMIDKVEHERPLSVPSSSGLRVFTRHVGGLVLYELTPLDSALVLDAVRASR